MHNFKNIHIGKTVETKVIERNIEISRLCNYFKCKENEIHVMFSSKSLDAEVLLKWSKLLDYDFFRFYSQHLILYAPQENASYNNQINKKSSLPEFRKNIYTKEIIDSILEMIKKGKKSKAQVIEQYRIPKTTLYKWIEKYTNEQPNELIIKNKLK
ncbi:transposase [Chryseobacterium paludis]|uniref:transposase n=1 Tax=Chryseobacterium paludis TaxID=2956784 RepID=UPI0021BEE4E2|nr:transposase [Chryseobacterium paludis]